MFLGRLEGRHNRLSELRGLGQLRPVASREIDEGAILHRREFGHERNTAVQPLLQLRSRELAADHCDGHVVPARVAEHLHVARESRRYGDRDLPEVCAQVVGQVGEVGILEHVPVGQRNLSVHHGQFVVDGVALAERAGVDVDHAGHGIRPGIHNSGGDRATTAVPDEHDARGQRVDESNDRVDIVAQRDAGAVVTTPSTPCRGASRDAPCAPHRGGAESPRPTSRR